jgi:uncharacterized protein
MPTTADINKNTRKGVLSSAKRPKEKDRRMTIKELYDLVELQSKEFDKREHVADGVTWKYHLAPVIKNSIMLAKKYGANLEVVEIAALFHDYANMIDFEKYDKTHHIAGGDLAEPILKNAGYAQDFIDRVKRCIFSHRSSVSEQKLTIEEVCVADADALTHIENVFELIVWRGNRGDTVEYANAFVKRKIQKDFAKLSDQSKKYIKDRYDAVMKIFY